MKDFEVISFQTKEDMDDYLTGRKEDDIWAQPKISDCRVISAEHNPEKIKDTLRNGSIPVPEELIAECDRDTLYLKFPYKGKIALVPLRYTAMSSLYARAGIGGRTISNDNDRVDARILSKKRKAEILTEFLKLYDSKSKILVREGKISAFLTGQYAVLPMSDLVEAINNQLVKEYPLAEYVSSSASYEFCSINWKLNDDDTEESLREILNTTAEVSSGLKFLTSDIGCANASVYPYFYVDGKMLRFGKPMEIKHFGKKTVEDFAKLLPGLNASFKTNMKQLENLQHITITHPADCFRAIAYHVGLPKKICMKLSEDLELRSFCPAFEVYYQLNRILENLEENGVTYLLKMQEAVASTLYLDYTRFDFPFSWGKEV